MRPLIPLLLVAILTAGCSASAGSVDGGLAPGEGTVRTIPLQERGEPVVLAGVDLDGDPLVLPTSSDRATVLNVWWSGCTQCRLEAPALGALASDPARNADYYGINVREAGRAQAKRFEERYGVPYPSFFDPGGKLLLGLDGTVPYAAIPTTVILDRQMRVGAVIMGVIPSTTTMKDVIAEVG